MPSSFKSRCMSNMWFTHREKISSRMVMRLLPQVLPSRTDLHSSRTISASALLQQPALERATQPSRNTATRDICIVLQNVTGRSSDRRRRSKTFFHFYGRRNFVFRQKQPLYVLFLPVDVCVTFHLVSTYSWFIAMLFLLRGITCLRSGLNHSNHESRHSTSLFKDLIM